MGKKFYIAYGSNLNIAQMRRRCPEARIIGTAALKGWQLLFKGSQTGAYLTIERDPDFIVPVAVWEVSPNDEKHLDHYEGFPRLYYKKELPVLVNGSPLTAFVYIMHEYRPIAVPSSTYVSTCLEGYHVFGFDTGALAAAYDHSKEVVEHERW